MTIQRAVTLSDGNRLRTQLCELLRDQIISGVLRPGRRLVERDLAQDFGVSRVPVREAIQLLIAEGFVEAVSPRRIVVRQLSRRDVEELFDVREALEVLITRQAAQRADRAALGRFEELLEEARLATVAGEPAALSRANAAFHHHMVEMSDNRLVASLLEPLEGRLRWVYQQIDDAEHVWLEHRELFAAVSSGDVDAAGRCALSHVRRNREAAMELLYGAQTPTAATGESE
jgi:DNA-binding GntR family transcriptional regulator